MNNRKVRFVEKLLLPLSVSCCINFNVQTMNNQPQAYGCQSTNNNNTYQQVHYQYNNNANNNVNACRYCGCVNNMSCNYCQARVLFCYRTGWPYEIFDYIYYKNPIEDKTSAVNTALNVKKSYDYFSKIYRLNNNPDLEYFREHYINAGAYGVVFKIKDEKQNKEKVSKLCFYDCFNSKKKKNWILSEASLLQELQSVEERDSENSQYLSIPNFVGIYNKSRYDIKNEKSNNSPKLENATSSVDREDKFLVSEYDKADCDLLDFYEKGKFKSLSSECSSVFLKKLYVEMLMGLSVLHKSGLVHGDIKVDNILMSSKANGFGFIFKLHDRSIRNSVAKLSQMKDLHNSLKFQKNVRNIRNTGCTEFAGFPEFFQNDQEEQVFEQISNFCQKYEDLESSYNYYSEKELIKEHLYLLQKLDMYMLYSTLLNVYNNLALDRSDRKVIYSAIEDLKNYKNAQEALEDSVYIGRNVYCSAVKRFDIAKADFDREYKWIPEKLEIKNK